MAGTIAGLPVAGAGLSRRDLLLPLLAALLVAGAIVACGIGAVRIPPGQVLSLLLAGWSDAGAATSPQAQDAAVLWLIRLPRVVLAALVGAALGASGAAIQGLFRNPLADPGLIGVAGGAALAAVAWIVLGAGLLPVLPPGLRAWLLPVAAFGGGLAATALVQRIGQRGGALDIADLLLAGIAVNAITMAGVGGLVFASDEQELREVTFWMMGSLAGATWSGILPALAFMLAPLLALPFLARALDALLLGEREAFHLGFRVERTKRLVIVAAACATGAAVAVTGVIGFVGLAAPHLARLLVGPGHRRLLPATACLGGCLVLLADTVARVAVVPAELPIGVLTAGIGGPFFLHLLMRRRQRGRA
jgi:iron complex transport system permease protein